MNAEQNKAAQALSLHVMRAILETVREAGDGGAPLGLMYAVFMTFNISLEAFNKLIDNIIKHTKLIEKRGDCLYWTGPKP